MEREKVERRVRRPRDKDGLIQTLIEEGPFTAIRDVLVFAAAVGYAHKAKKPFTEAGDAIRWEVAVNRRGTETLVNMLAVAEHPETAEILADARFDERLRIFEEYANGGLEVIQGELNTRYGGATDVVLRLVRKFFESDGDSQTPDLASLAKELSW